MKNGRCMDVYAQKEKHRRIWRAVWLSLAPWHWSLLIKHHTRHLSCTSISEHMDDELWKYDLLRAALPVRKASGPVEEKQQCPPPMGFRDSKTGTQMSRDLQRVRQELRRLPIQLLQADRGRPALRSRLQQIFGQVGLEAVRL